MMASKEPGIIASEDNLEVTKIQKDLLWGLYQDLRTHARHAETLRASAVNYMLVFAAALITVITFDHEIDMKDLPLSLILSLIGLITALFSASYAELYFRNRERAEHIRGHLDAVFFKGSLNSIYVPRDNLRTLKYDFQWARQITKSTHWFWILLPVIVLAVGLVLTCMCLAA